MRNRASMGLVEVEGLREVRKEGEMVDRVLVWVWRTERRRMVERSDIWMLVQLIEEEGSRTLATIVFDLEATIKGYRYKGTSCRCKVKSTTR